MTDPSPPQDINPRVPAGLSDLVMRLLEKDVWMRIATVAEVVSALQLLEKQTTHRTS